ncbi:MAG: phytanoyl-CoA dioxygenase family protein [Planctomycetaceae bacterium]
MSEKTTFKMIPERDELSSVQRVLQFHPATTQSPAELSAQQIDDFNRDGFLFPFAIFSPEETAEHRRYFDALLNRTLSEGKDSYSISTAHLKHGRVYDLLCHPKIVAIVSDLLGPDVVGWGSHYFCKMPGDGKTVTWHQDASYWPLTPSKAVTVWLAIDDADRENACVRFIPGSHQHGLISFEDSSSEEGNVLDQTVKNPEDYGDAPVDVVLKAGEISIHSDLLLHGSEANESNRRRCGLTLRYCAADVRAHLDWNQKGVVVAGADPSGHWANPTRPTDE